MTTRRRRRFTAAFKKRVVLEALRRDRTVQEIAARHEVHPNQVSTWKPQAVDGLDEVFANGKGARQSEQEARIRYLLINDNYSCRRIASQRLLLSARRCLTIPATQGGTISTAK